MVGSLAAYAAKPDSAVYSASKAALEMLTDALRRMLKPLKIWVSIIEPGYVASGMCDRPECHATSPGSTTTPVIIDALISSHPRVRCATCSLLVALLRLRAFRYPVAGANGLPAWLIVALHSVLPGHLVDHLYDALGVSPSHDAATKTSKEL